MAISFLKKPVNNAPKTSLRYMLHKHLSGYEPGRPLHNIHASELTKAEGFCPRYYALSDLEHSKPADQWLTTSEQLTFLLGRVIQDAIVHWFADMGKAICHWKCRHCHLQQKFCSRPSQCPTCGNKEFAPVEVRFVSKINGASCGVDMLVNMGEGKLRPVEIKTMEKDKFSALAAPMAEHKWRTNLYLRLIDEDPSFEAGQVMTDQATILYATKGGYGIQDAALKADWNLTDQFSPFKEYVIERDDSQTDAIAALAKSVTDFRNGGPMPKGICSSIAAKRAQYCPRKKPCWSGEYPH